MFSIFKKQKKTEEQVDDPGVVQVSSASTSSDQPNLISPQCNKKTDRINDLSDLGDRESGPRRPELAVCNMYYK
jgi:hypothetical protein